MSLGVRLRLIVSAGGTLAALTAIPETGTAQQRPPKDVNVSIDTFTGDTLTETKYGRLDQPFGCKRDNLSIVWRLSVGPTGRREAVLFDLIDLGDAFTGSSGRWIGAVSLALNVDGAFVVGEMPLIPSKLGNSGTQGRTESGGFWLPTGTLRAVADARLAKLRIVGTERTCDGTIELNMQTRLKALLGFAKEE